ncbi:MAG: glycosyltransferase [Bacteroidia bacterium]|nr:glycosyltransferase [Bacteroidia bacterium]
MKILVLASRFPYPIEKGDKLRLYHQLRVLSRQHEIILCALHTDPIQAADLAAVSQYCQTVYLLRQRPVRIAWSLLSSLWGSMPAQTAYFWDPALHRKIQEIATREQPDHVYCQLIRMAPYIDGLTMSATLDYMDCFSAGLGRNARLAAGWVRPWLEAEARKTARYEQLVFQWFGSHTVISAADRDALPLAEAHTVEVVPNGIDTAYFRPYPTENQRYDVMFVGNMGYMPNVQAARCLVREIMPAVWAVRPDTTVLLAGARPAPEVVAMQQDTRVTVSGWVEDIRTAYAAGRILAAPIFSGSGQQNKILEALAMGCCCVTTPQVQAGIGAPPAALMVADTPQAFAALILRGLQDPALRADMRREARSWVEGPHAWEHAAGLLCTLLENTSTPTPKNGHT